ncbi:DUF4340 domain-containing protein [Puniceicoccales bacterium CK1056]|uniref:DUF4340 domain-containing protein n=1 Tax=Oceanipulchritudo coccoides TaxID=2706888 RepID=A0A6B2M4J3_9BACT|nr:DUF4340 domain-containing protein [Oceanipulchritudo coccoides]NDV62550.1 DUF4340 domain-containing protein [Oceanipulchritudo coccoides]
MRFKLTILLLALNAALACIIFYFDKVQSTQNLLDESSRLIINPDFVQDLERIEIKGLQTDQEWILEREKDQWLVSSPFEWKANPFAVEQLIFQLRRLAWESRFPVSGLESSGQSLESYDLANPTITLTLEGGESSLDLSLGAPTEIGNRLYLLSPDGEYIYVVARGLLDSLQRDLEAFLDRRIFSISVEETRAMQIQDRSASNIRVRLERNEDKWAFVSPIETAADADRVKTLLTEWQGLEVEGFENTQEGEITLNGNAIRLSLEGSSERQSIILTPVTEGEEAGMTYLARLEGFPTVFRVQAGKVERLRSVQEDLREKRVLKRYSEDWSSLAINFGELGVTLQRLENDSWQVLYTDKEKQLRSMPAAAEAVNAMKELLNTMEAERFVTDAPSEADLVRFGLNEPQRRLQVRKGSQESVELKIGGLYSDEGQTLFYASTDQSDSVFLVRPYVLSSLSLDPFNYRERIIRKLPGTARISGLSLIHRPSGLAVPMDPESSDIARAVQAALRDFVGTVRVDRFTNRPFSDPLVLADDRELEWKYIVEASVQYPSNPEDAETIRLYLSERLGGTSQYIGDPESGLVGFLPIRMIEILDSFLAEYPDTPEPLEEQPAVEVMEPVP